MEIGKVVEVEVVEKLLLTRLRDLSCVESQIPRLKTDSYKFVIDKRSGDREFNNKGTVL